MIVISLDKFAQLLDEEGLTVEQKAAVMDNAREVLTIACAGSGKSTTLAFRIARLLYEGVDPKSIVAFTFTDKAAESMKRAVAKALLKVGIEPTVLGAMYIGTIHSYCQHLLRQIDAKYQQFEVLDDNRLKLYLISRYQKLGLEAVRNAHPTKKGNPRGYFDTINEVSSAWKTANEEMLDNDAIRTADPVLGEVLQRITESLDRDRFIDFSLMIRIVVEALQAKDERAEKAVSTVRHLMIDEYQDINPLQEALIREFHSRVDTLFAVGDDDQAIYAWRGADVTGILNFTSRYPLASRHTLSTNFRSTRTIVDVANEFVAAELGAMRLEKNPEAADRDGPRDFRVIWFADRDSEAEWVASRIKALLGTAYTERNGQVRGLTPGDFAILMRSTREPEGDEERPRHKPFTEALERKGIAYSLEGGGGAFDRPQVECLRETFELLRYKSPTRTELKKHFDDWIVPYYPKADFDKVAKVMAKWGRTIHGPTGGARQRIYPQQILHDLLNAFGLAEANFDTGTMQDIGLFSRMMQDVETVYVSVDSPERFREVLNFLKNIAEKGYDTGTEGIVKRPDLVTVSTVHKVKGLEFPVVFVVDVEDQRFPARQRGYSGWLPKSVFQPALDRGAHQRTPEEEARIFYTALTRAERYLYVTGSAKLPGVKRVAKQSRFALRLQHDEIRRDPNDLPVGLVKAEPCPRKEDTVVPATFSDIRYYLRCPYDYSFRKNYGFRPPINEMFGFGTTVHTAISKLHELYPNRAPTEDEARTIAGNVFHLKHVPPSSDPENRPGGYEKAKQRSMDIAATYASDYSQDFSRKRQVQARFEIPAEMTVITGEIDLLLEEDPEGNILKATVIDFKAIEGGEEPDENETLEWTELALQVQLYAKAARDILGQNARTGAVHLLKDNQRVEIPVTEEAVNAAVKNVEWAVSRILAVDFPMRPETTKCAKCDFKALCPQKPQPFKDKSMPPPIHLPFGKTEMVLAFSRFTPNRK